MTYLFDDFKAIKTFPANTRVYRDGIFVPELSDENVGEDLPLHIIHVGKITGIHDWFIDINNQQNVFVTAKIEASGDTKIKLEINANLENIESHAKLIIKNTGDLTLDVVGNNNKAGTKIRCQTKLIAGPDTTNVLAGSANVPSNCAETESDIQFAALCDPRIKLLKMSPEQRISSIPIVADHSASIYKPSESQIRYLNIAGLTNRESEDLLEKVFAEEISE